jgi:Fe-S-cluster-containing dehydrogenase component
VDACPFGVVVLHPETGLPLICDLCGGEPACVVRCATGAISYGHEAAVSPGKQHDRSIEPDGAGKEAA